MLFVSFVYYDIQLRNMNKQVNKEKKVSKWKSTDLGCHNGGTSYV